MSREQLALWAVLRALRDRERQLADDVRIATIDGKPWAEKATQATEANTCMHIARKMCHLHQVSRIVEAVLSEP